LQPLEPLEKERPSLGLIEDDPVMGRSLEHRLALEGYRVDWWQSGAAAPGSAPGSEARPPRCV
jgi:DNA-binding response OmpR family regulator